MMNEKSPLPLTPCPVRGRGGIQHCVSSCRRLRVETRVRAGVLSLAVLLVVVAVVACSPEAERVRGDGPGADIGNSAPPILMHGDRERNNPEFRTPRPGRAPDDARGV